MNNFVVGYKVIHLFINFEHHALLSTMSGDNLGIEMIKSGTFVLKKAQSVRDDIPWT